MPQMLTQEDFLNLNQPALAIVRVAALGDIVASEPVIRYAKKNYPHCITIWLLREEFTSLLRVHPLLDYLVSVSHLEEATNLAKKFLERPQRQVINLHFARQLCIDTNNFVTNDNDPKISIKTYYNYGSLLEAFSLAAGLPKLSVAPHFFLDPQTNIPELPPRYILFHCQSRDTARNWDPVKWKKLLYYFIGQDIDVIEIGLTPLLTSRNPKYHDFTHINNLQTLAHIIAKAEFFFGIDSGFAHIANALHVNGLIIMGKFTHFTQHNPYIGFYANDHIIRLTTHSAFHVEVDAVIAHYQRLKENTS